MSTYLEMVQDVARESGTVQPSQITSVANQTGRIQQIVHWVAMAWKRVQTQQDHWRFMRGEWSGTLIAGAATYTAASFNIPDLARWLTDQPHAGYWPVTIYRESTGVADEGILPEISYTTWRSRYGRGTQTNNKPTCYSVTPTGALSFGPSPDDAYVVRGEYYRTPQALELNDDTPQGLPERFHQIIVYRALMMLHGHDEAQGPLALANAEYRSILADLERDQLPAVGIAWEPLA